MNTRKTLTLELTGIIGAALVAILLGIIIIYIVSEEPLTAIQSLLLGPISSAFNIGTVLNKAVPLIFTGLALAIVFQAGVFSMGAEGQLYMGAFVGALAALYIPGLPVWVHLPIIFLAAICAGAIFGAIPGFLKAYLNTDEIVTTLMLNFIAILSTSYFVNNIFKDPASGGYARMQYIASDLRLGRIVEGFTAHYGIIIALATVIVIYLLLYKTKFGYELRMVGQNSRFAHYGGISTKKIIILSVVISGGLAALAGIIEILGVHGTFKDYFSINLGFDGIIIALLARNHPFGVAVAALFYAYLQVGAQLMQGASDVPRELAVIIQVILVLLVSSQAIFTFLRQKYLLRQGR
ncbi:nucleoside ABC transporter membrane protein [Seinonella peptonophila]|uniref:Nucleoside ABC transporter membrane protein n=1 Tax=Seinonella peptonophila TaxID=112248 RepID=A0A1M5A5V8_9BACL|nr:ABC transporter permease [Seinonella peptonophila]SHF25688.1 nucleoside ABC transporter membrane protein [Seinonella peptonophila]